MFFFYNFLRRGLYLEQIKKTGVAFATLALMQSRHWYIIYHVQDIYYVQDKYHVQDIYYVQDKYHVQGIKYTIYRVYYIPCIGYIIYHVQGKLYTMYRVYYIPCIGYILPCIGYIIYNVQGIYYVQVIHHVQGISFLSHFK